MAGRGVAEHKPGDPIPPGMQVTPKGLLIPIPTRDEFFAALDKVIGGGKRQDAEAKAADPAESMAASLLGLSRADTKAGTSQ